MPLEAAFRNIEQHLRRLREHLSQLAFTLVQERPKNGELALTDALTGAAHDLTGILDEALSAVVDPSRVTEPRRTLMIANERLNRFSQFFWSYLQSYERLAELNRIGRERGGQWLLWSYAVHQTIEQCRQPLYDAHAAVFQCWHKVTEWALQTPAPDQAIETHPLPLRLTAQEQPAAGHELPIMTSVQASLYHRARAMRAQVLPILNALIGLRADLDLARFQALRAIIGAELDALVQELGRSGGPRVARMDSLFESMLGQLQSLHEEAGLERERVDSTEQEWQVTNFQIVQDYIDLLRRSWQEVRDAFSRESGPANSLSRQLVELMRALEITAESEREVEAVLDSVLLGPAERQQTILTISDTPPLSVAELLDWIEQFAGGEGPRLIADAGPSAFKVIAETLARLYKLLNNGLLNAPADRLPAGYHDPRVRQSLQRLDEQIKHTIALTH